MGIGKWLSFGWASILCLCHFQSVDKLVFLSVYLSLAELYFHVFCLCFLFILVFFLTELLSK